MSANSKTSATSIAALFLILAIPAIAGAQNTSGATAHPPGPTKTSVSSTILGGAPPKVFYACYIPSSGVTYRIKEVDIKQTCSADHVMFSWTDGGTAGPQGPKGDPGPQGAPGPQGTPGASGFTEITYVQSASVFVKPGEFGIVTADCPAGTKVGGGGFAILGAPTPRPALIQSIPDEQSNSWKTVVNNLDTANGSAQVASFAVCFK